MRAERCTGASSVSFSIFVAGLSLLLAPCVSWAGVSLTAISGAVQVHSTDWVLVSKTPMPLEEGETVRTAAGASAILIFTDGSRVELTGNTSFTVERTETTNYFMGLSLGRLRAFVSKVAARKFQVRTPTAVCAVRGTEFQVEVMSDGSTNVDLYKGLLAVEDHRGQQILLHPHESTRVDYKGLGAPKRTALRQALDREKLRGMMRRELVLDQSRKQIQAAAVRELRLADYQEGKTVINAFGDRVRVEEYIVRPSPDQFKLVVLDSAKASFNYFYYLGTFNTTLPTDLSVALNQLQGTVGAPPTYYLTSFQTARSNTVDSVVEIANGGHPVNVNNNASNDPNEVVTSYFNAAQNAYLAVPTGTAFYKTLFDNDGLYVDGQLKSGWTGSGILTYRTDLGSVGPTASTTNDPITGALLATALPTLVGYSNTFPNANLIQQRFLFSYSDNTFLNYDNYIIDNNGKIATTAQFSNATDATSFHQQLLNFNYEQVITASEFGGRTIDLVVAPKILVQSGLIQ